MSKYTNTNTTRSEQPRQRSTGYNSYSSNERYPGYVPSSSRSSERAERSGKKSGNQNKDSDPIGSMLLFQIKICLIVLLLFGTARLTGGVLFQQSRELASIACGTTESKFPLEEISNWWNALPSAESWLQPIENMGEWLSTQIKHWINGNISTEIPTKEDEAPATERDVPPAIIGESDSAEQQTTSNETLDPRQGSTDVRVSMSYPSVNPSDWWETALCAAAIRSGKSAVNGMGGILPKQSDLNTFGFLEAPQNAMLCPIITTAKIRVPVYGTVTSPFGYRYHPITYEADFHSGLDIAAPEGTSIHAAYPGEVIEAGWSDSYGYRVVIRHSDKLQTTYNHCSKLLVTPGINVAQGDRVALVGSTGIATGPHLHFEVLVDGKRADPLWIIPTEEYAS